MIVWTDDNASLLLPLEHVATSPRADWGLEAIGGSECRKLEAQRDAGMAFNGSISSPKHIGANPPDSLAYSFPAYFSRKSAQCNFLNRTRVAADLARPLQQSSCVSPHNH